ncbi:MAG: hypothetical protein NXH75_06135 [Halobacteriovoraceae bacterium]|nr:hypothetical protein [Halobacteriovoraceae bacterium]
MWKLWKKQYRHTVKLRHKTIKYWGAFLPLYERVKEEANAEVLEIYPNSNILHINF